MRTRKDRRQLIKTGLTMGSALALSPSLFAQNESPHPRFQRIPLQYIAALSAPDARYGNNAQDWGIWRDDPGPRGVALADYNKLLADDGWAPAGWQFDSSDWWLEENGLIMEQPDFPLTAGHYLVTGNREKVSMLTVHPVSDEGMQHWELDNDASIYDVTHLRCRSGRYQSAGTTATCTPAQASQQDFPVPPGAAMPDVGGCLRQDYAVLIVYATAEY